MSNKYKDRNKWKDLVGKYNVCCDRSGHVFYNHEMMVDHRNRVVAKQYADPIHWSEYPWTLPVENSKLPFRRPIVHPTEGVQQRRSWSQTEFTWAELHRLWSARY